MPSQKTGEPFEPPPLVDEIVESKEGDDDRSVTNALVPAAVDAGGITVHNAAQVYAGDLDIPVTVTTSLPVTFV